MESKGGKGKTKGSCPGPASPVVDSSAPPFSHLLGTLGKDASSSSAVAAPDAETPGGAKTSGDEAPAAVAGNNGESECSEAPSLASLALSEARSNAGDSAASEPRGDDDEETARKR